MFNRLSPVHTMQTVELRRACEASIEATNQKLLLSRAKSTVDEVELGLRLSIISALLRFTSSAVV
ncbi:unnamed protein product [Rhodiola kirilowii]